MRNVGRVLANAGNLVENDICKEKSRVEVNVNGEINEVHHHPSITRVLNLSPTPRLDFTPYALLRSSFRLPFPPFSLRLSLITYALNE